ncbi:hypothetical protein PR202_gb02805 [Eleusine coracana subsp. coracana]|uniref:RING-type domain-containing protein n=1 Tax=Eleusine coracana subsp. coracana TaxID=191504 RepID=A0AAV5E059_ELECO|nr:hypothetical protein PR202_gb02805 [Eleusine coracana subsp. coracana]
MGNFCSRDDSPGRQPHQYNHIQNHNSNAAPRGGAARYARIGDEYETLDQVTDALAHAGLESSNLIVGIDFTKSNEWTGKRSFNNKSLHAMGDTPNPYEQAISIVGRTLARFDEDNLIPCFGFGDVTTHDQKVFSFYSDNEPCDGFEQALDRYREIVPQLCLSGPTSFAPIIETAIGIVDSSGGQYHVLLIIADGQVTRSINTGNGQFSPQEQATIDAIVKASKRRGFSSRLEVSPPPVSDKQHPGCSAVQKDKKQHSGYSGAKETLSTSYGSTSKTASAPRQESDVGDQQTCPICWSEAKNLAFGCGHQTCAECAKDLKVCPLCQRKISTRIRLY